MRLIVAAVCLLVLSCSAPSSQAQDGPPPVETIIGYYEDENPSSLGVMLLQWNVCFERFVTLNPGLEFDNIPYGTPILLPENEPCYDYAAGGQFAVSGDTVPRLKYYEDSAWLAKPYYTGEVTYAYFRDIDHVVAWFDVCREDLLAENWALQTYGDRYLQLQWASVDLFIPQDKLPCNDETSPSWLKIVRHASSFSPVVLTEEFNICPEEAPSMWWSVLYGDTSSYEMEFRIPQPAPPCYNDQGQRLIYFALDGTPLDKPEYTDLPIHRVQPGETLEAIVEQHGVCLIDFIRLNYFPELPIERGEIEVFIPPSRPCPDDVRLYEPPADEHVFYDLIDASIALDICYEALAALNPHLHPSHFATAEGQSQPGPYRRGGWNKLLLLPTAPEPCYTNYEAERNQSIYDIERELNICHEAFLRSPATDKGRLTQTHDVVIHFRRDTPPCYDDQGRRLQYEPDLNRYYRNIFHPVAYKPHLDQSPEYSAMAVHPFGRADTVYSVSRQYNVCVHDLLLANPLLLSALPEGFPTFIPNTRPCYDEATGMPLIYEDENGVPLPEPQVGDKLIYYGTQPFSRISHYYNVCQNRIEDANAAKIAGETRYLGWIIPHDWPACYDELSQLIDGHIQQHIDSGGIAHNVQPGETLAVIARLYNKSAYWIAAANDLTSLDLVRDDQVLIIPKGVTKTDVYTISAMLLVFAAIAAAWLWGNR